MITFFGMSTDGLMAHDVSDELKGRAAGFSQAGIRCPNAALHIF